MRRDLREELAAGGCSEDHSADTVVMTSELVSNALIHARSEARVDLRMSGGTVRVGVADAGPGVPRVRPPDPSRVGGNGLRIVDTLAGDWGIIHRPRGKEVWFELAC
jgi:anti-sigma regulatory factor (Ser/Thr protein kinase)